MKKHLVGFSFLVSFLLVISPAGAANIKIMTQNQYIGAAIERFLAATDPASFNAAVVAALQTAAATKTPERMRALANEITKEQPALVGLQEVDQLQCIDLAPPIPGSGCSDPSIAAAFSDHLQLTLQDLQGTYVKAAEVINFNIPGIPFFINDVPALLGVVDRDVILAREGVKTKLVDFTKFQNQGFCLKPSVDGCNYGVALEVETPFFDEQGNPIVIDVERGFVAVDTTIEGKDYRVVTTHPEIQHPDPMNPASQLVQVAQAFELINTLLNTTPIDRSLIVVGDMNSDPREPDIPGLGIVTPYHQFVEAGFTDIWELRPGNQPGYTCCQAEDLSNRHSTLDQRIDMIFSLDVPAKVKNLRVVGDKVSAKTPPPGHGLWPSDHASLTAELQFQLLTAKK